MAIKQLCLIGCVYATVKGCIVATDVKKDNLTDLPDAGSEPGTINQETAVARVQGEKRATTPNDIRSLAVSGSDLFTTIKWETLRDDGTVFYIGDIQDKHSDYETTGNRALLLDVYSDEGELMGRCQVAAMSVQTQIDDLRRAYPTSPYFGPFKIVKWGKTYKLEPVRS